MGLQIQPPPSNAPVGLLGRSKDFEYLLWLVKIPLTPQKKALTMSRYLFCILHDLIGPYEIKKCVCSLLRTLLCENLKALTRRTVLLASFIP